MDKKIQEEIYRTWNKIGKFKSVDDYEQEISLHKKLLEIMHVGDFYYFIFAPPINEIQYTSPSFKTILGYETEDLTMEKFLSIIHPDDLPFFLDFECTVVDFKLRLPPTKIMSYKTRYNYRIRKKSGDYIHILQQSTTVQTDEDGAVLRNLVIHTDISHLKRANDTKMSLSFIGLGGEPSFIDVTPSQKFIEMASVLSPREKEIVQLISQNKSTKDISVLLNISVETVATHRKNINSKTGAKNALELVMLALDKGWI
ncbi:MAG: LuxR C-terminal-related transcriptional regulator [Crocinitomicaceae bacterium]|nr:LuxR C-terminal-related transcriptional regulator [Crocinitomicaceae bacterium]